MSQYTVPPGSTSRSVYVRVYKDSGQGNATPLAYNASGLAVTYARDNGSPVAVTLVALSSATAAYSSGGWAHRGNGEYRCDLPDAALAAGATVVSVLVAEAIDVRAEPCLILLDAPVSSRLAPTTAGRALAVDADGRAAADVTRVGGQAATAAAPVAFPAAVGTSTFAGGAVASVAAAVTVGGYASGQAPADALLANGLTGSWAAGVDAQSLAAQTAAATASARAGTLLDRLGGWGGTGVNTVLGALRALASKLPGLTPPDLTAGGAGYDNATDSLQARADAPVVAPLPAPAGGSVYRGVYGTAPTTLAAGERAALAGLLGAAAAQQTADLIRGPGATPTTIRLFRDAPANTLPLADADAWVTTDAAGLDVVAGTFQTDSLGDVTFRLNAGLTYYAWATKDGFNPVEAAPFVAD